MKEIEKYKIELDPKEVLKSKWKKEVKSKITIKEEDELQKKCLKSTKARIVKDDEYKRKEYLSGKMNFTVSRQILLTRLNMNKIPGNFKGKGDGKCFLCGEKDGKIEHYFQCKNVRGLVEVWDVGVGDLTSQDLPKMMHLSMFMKKVEVMLEPFKVY